MIARQVGRDRQHRVDRWPVPLQLGGLLQRGQGRAADADQAAGGRVGALRHPRQCDHARLHPAPPAPRRCMPTRKSARRPARGRVDRGGSAAARTSPAWRCSWRAKNARCRTAAWSALTAARRSAISSRAGPGILGRRWFRVTKSDITHDHRLAVTRRINHVADQNCAHVCFDCRCSSRHHIGATASAPSVSDSAKSTANDTYRWTQKRWKTAKAKWFEGKGQVGELQQAGNRQEARAAAKAAS